VAIQPRARGLASLPDPTPPSAPLHSRAVEQVAGDRKVVPGAILGGIAALCVFLGEVPLLALLLVLGLVAAGELLRLARGRGAKPVALVGLGAVAGTYVVAYLQDVRAPEHFAGVVGAALIATSALVLLRANREGAVVSIATTVFVVVYVGAMGAYMVAMRGMPDGFRIVLVFGLMVLMNDVGAWLVGRRAGRHAMAPSVSPDKTWEGWLGGTLFTFVVGILTGIGLDPPMTVGRGLVLAALVVVVAPLGDLFESMLKRDFGVKDAGRLIPAHGGALDRLDSLLFTAPLFFYAFRALAS
jgi:phosphatidate cytidylyltransferase